MFGGEVGVLGGGGGGGGRDPHCIEPWLLKLQGVSLDAVKVSMMKPHGSKEM